MKPIRQFHHVLLGGFLLLVFAAGGLAQVPQLQGVGLSGQSVALDTMLVQGDSLLVIASYAGGPEWSVYGVGFASDSANIVRLLFYPQSIPSGNPVNSLELLIPHSAVHVDTSAQPHRFKFATRLPEVNMSEIGSFQLEMAIHVLDSIGIEAFSDPKTSFIPVGSVQAATDSIDDTHAHYVWFDNSPQIQGMGLSGSPTVRDTAVVEGDTLYAVMSYFTSPEFHVAGLGVARDSLDIVRVYLNQDPTPSRAPIGEIIVRPDSASVVIDSISDPPRIHFHAKLHNVINPLVQSLQLEALVYWYDLHGTPYVSTLRTSFSQVGNAPAVLNSVDGLHSTYLTFRDVYTFPPHITYPDSGAVLGRHFRLIYDQPEDADSSMGVRLTITNTDSLSTESPHILHLTNRFAGTGKILHLDAANLLNHTEVDTVFGSRSLTHLGTYRFVLTYRDSIGNPPASDTVRAIRVDMRTETPLFFEPTIGYQPTDPNDSTVYVFYVLPERADSVWLTFAADTVSNVIDSLSPHILRLDASLNGPGPVTFHLNGKNIGTNNPLVAESNRGQADSLKSQTIYRVTLTYGDTLGNDNVSVTNSGYVWPRDHTTIPPRLISPPPPPALILGINTTIPVEYVLPEVPLNGSVYMNFQAQGAGGLDRGSPHLVYIRTESPGHQVFALNARALSSSNVVDTVTGAGTFDQNNTLVDSVRYAVRVFYRDSLGNPPAQSLLSFIFCDFHTRPGQISSPLPGDTMAMVNMLVAYSLPEMPYPGSLRLVFTRTNGDADVGSPHTLYLTNDTLGPQTILVQPASLTATQGVSRVEGGQALVPRTIYQLSLFYSDTLNNPAARTDVNGLVYPSGSAVVASGRSLGSGIIIPSTYEDPVFRLSLQTLNGSSVLRRLRFTVQGSVQPIDVYAPGIKLFTSVDTTFSEADDHLIRHLSAWTGGEMVFDSFTVGLSNTPTFFFVTLLYPVNASPSHTVFLSLAGPSAVDCGTDPVVSDTWPIGSRDVPLAVTLTSFGTSQDTLFGALRVAWMVASETDNSGFILSRRAENETSYTVAADWRQNAELQGRGSAPTAARYQFIDRNLTPGRRYTYRLAAESINGDRIQFADSTIGVPRIPPSTFILGDAYPNPFNQDVTLAYVVPVTANVQIIIYDLLGREVRRLVEGHLAPAEYRAVWDSRNNDGVLMPSGVYWCRLKAGNSYMKAKKLLLLR